MEGVNREEVKVESSSNRKEGRRAKVKSARECLSLSLSLPSLSSSSAWLSNYAPKSHNSMLQQPTLNKKQSISTLQWHFFIANCIHSQLPSESTLRLTSKTTQRYLSILADSTNKLKKRLNNRHNRNNRNNRKRVTMLC